LVEINLEEEKAKYQAELDQFIRQLGELNRQMATLQQAIAERQGIIAFLNSLNEHKEA
jgi:prefoldin subunit 5